MIFATKLIKHLAVQTTQVLNPGFIRECYNTYTLWKHYHNPYLSIDCPDKKKQKRKMNSFCRFLTDAIQFEFHVNAHIFVSKKKKIVHLSLHKPLIYYPYFKKIVTFIRKYWENRKYFHQPYTLQYLKLNQSIKWCFDYIIAVKKSKKKKTEIEKIMDAQLDRFYEDIEFSVRNAFREYIVKVSQLNSSFFVLIKSY